MSDINPSEWLDNLSMPLPSSEDLMKDSITYLAKADDMWDSEPDERDWLPKYDALVRTASVYAELAKVQHRSNSSNDLDSEDLRP